MAIHLNHTYNLNTLTPTKLPKTTPYPNPPSHIKTTTERKKRRSRTAFRVHAAAGGASGSAVELLQTGAVRAIRTSEAAEAVAGEGYVVLDVRPAWEREKAHVTGSVHVPLFVKDEDNGPLTLVKKWVHFGYIGLWTGQYFTTLNDEFVDEVEKLVPQKTTKLLVSCGEGLRSMMATSKLYEAGYTNLGWLVGGFNKSEEGDFPSVEGPEKLEYATIGGVSWIFLQLLIVLRAVGNKKKTD